jgi:LmbE family N-acetylglucosaminyl deacetylase
VTAHPDDLEFGCAGTVAAWADEGAEITVCIVSDGSTGTQDRDLMGPPLARIREEESRRAADLLGVARLEWLGYRDGYVEYSLGLRRDLARVFRGARPHRYMVMDPSPTIEERFINHPDHRAVAHASLDVTLTAGTTPGHFPELLDEGLEPWRGLRELWIAGPASGSRVVDISSTIDRKIEALLCHRSQVGDDPQTIEEWVRTWARRQGERAGFAYGESFQIISEGPGFHAGEDLEAVDFAFTPPPLDPRSAPARRTS